MNAPDSIPADDTLQRFSESYWRSVRELDILRLRQWELHRLTLPQLRILFSVARAPGITANELAALLGVTVSTTSGLVAKVVERGLVSKRVAVDDRRQMPLELTESGRRLTEEVAEAGRQLMEQTAALLGTDLDSVTTALDLLGAAVSRARELLDTPGPALSEATP
jgi:DNA-binding MarR family transcriptional regulator